MAEAYLRTTYRMPLENCGCPWCGEADPADFCLHCGGCTECCPVAEPACAGGDLPVESVAVAIEESAERIKALVLAEVSIGEGIGGKRFNAELRTILFELASVPDSPTPQGA
jgi:hypothetical protein